MYSFMRRNALYALFSVWPKTVEILFALVITWPRTKLGPDGTFERQTW